MGRARITLGHSRRGGQQAPACQCVRMPIAILAYYDHPRPLHATEWEPGRRWASSEV